MSGANKGASSVVRQTKPDKPIHIDGQRRETRWKAGEDGEVPEEPREGVMGDI